MSIEESLRALVRETVREAVREVLGAGTAPSSLRRELLTYEEAAAEVAVSTSTIKRWVRGGQLPARGKGKLRRVRVEDVRACLAGESKPKPANDVKANVTSILASVRR